MKERTSSLRVCLLFRGLALALILPGAFLVYFQTTAFFMARQSKSWPPAVGVLSVEVGEYRKTISYQYAVDGVSYESDRVIFGEWGNKSRSKEWDAVSNLPSGSEVTVHYKPANPRECTLVTRLVAGSWFQFLLGSVFLLAGTAIFILAAAIGRIAEQTDAGNQRFAGA